MLALTRRVISYYDAENDDRLKASAVVKTLGGNHYVQLLLRATEAQVRRAMSRVRR